ncbi:MAG: hypothetical protein L0Z62_10550, partial [Gemmataceae bacterium]|nr:hypothetical protein [Gemmataceae bacterium]
SQIDNIIGIKEATGDLERVNQLRASCGSTPFIRAMLSTSKASQPCMKAFVRYVPPWSAE